MEKHEEHHHTQSPASSEIHDMSGHDGHHDMMQHSAHDHQHEHSAHPHEDHNMHSEHEGHSVADFKKRFWVSVIITIPILLLSHTVQEFFGFSLSIAGSAYYLLVLSTIVFFYGGMPFLKGLVREIQNRKPGMMTLIAMAISAAYFYSTAITFGLRGMDFFWELVTLVDIMLLGHWIEMKSVLGASNALEELVKLLPQTAHKVTTNGQIEDIPLSDLTVKDTILVKPGEKIPADGKIIEGISSINESLLTGESKPVSKEAGNIVIGGSINGEGALKITIEKTGSDSFLSKVIALVRQAQQSRSRTQDIANRAALWLTIIALSAGTLSFIIWYFVLGSELSFAIERLVTVLVISCPHALGLAIPLVVSVSTTIAARNGLLIRDRSAFEAARNIQAIVLDKTGTLTKGSFGVTDVLVFHDKYSKEELLKIAASIESFSEHPIARAIAQSTKEQYKPENFQAIPGKGAEAIINNEKIIIASPGYVRDRGLSFDVNTIEPFTSVGKTVVFVIASDILIGAIALADIIRPESKEAIAGLKSLGIHTIMLTGDNPNVAKWVADQIAVDEYIAEVLPEQKSEKIKEIQSRGLRVCMVGDGVNDAPALAQSDIGIAIGAGTDVAAETADIILVKSNPLDVLALIRLARSTYGKMIQNLLWATGYNAFAIPLAAGVLAGVGIILTPAVGAVLMSLSTVIVAINSKLLKMK